MKLQTSTKPNQFTTPEDSLAERYFTFLGTRYVDDEGETKQPAKTRYIDLLREVHAAYKPRWDLNACLAHKQKDFKGRVWFWSDMHLFHTNVITYAERPFATCPEMNAAMMGNCLSRVTKDDILVFGGDIAMGNVTKVNALLRSIPSYKILILGNHDIEKRELLKYAVDETAACFNLELDGQSLFVTHYPVNEVLLEDDQLNMHGHIHNHELHPSLGDGRRHINMSVEFTGYGPVELQWLLENQRQREKEAERPASC